MSSPSTPGPANAQNPDRPDIRAGAAPAHKHVAPSRIVVHGDRGVKVSRSVSIRRSPEDLYAFWRDLENLAQISDPPIVVERRSDIASHWSVNAPGNGKVEWDAAIINDIPGRLIAWRSREGAEIPNAGTVRFEAADASEETKVTVVLEYDPPAGKFGAIIAKLSGVEPGVQIEQALQRLKHLMESDVSSTAATGRPADTDRGRQAPGL